MEVNRVEAYDEHETEGFETYLSREEHFTSAEGYEVDVDKRLRALQIIKKVYACETENNSPKPWKLDDFVPYVAVNYFDRFISRHPEMLVDSQFELCVVCCLFLAWKFRTKYFITDDYWNHVRPTPGEKWPEVLSLEFLRQPTQEAYFEMEFKILGSLEWRLRCLTPIYFLRYFLPWFKEAEDIDAKEFTRIVIASQSRMELVKFKPSVIAASTLLAMSKQGFDDETFIIKIIEKCKVNMEVIADCSNVIKDVMTEE